MASCSGMVFILIIIILSVVWSHTGGYKHTGMTHTPCWHLVDAVCVSAHKTASNFQLSQVRVGQ